MWQWFTVTTLIKLYLLVFPLCLLQNFFSTIWTNSWLRKKNKNKNECMSQGRMWGSVGNGASHMIWEHSVQLLVKVFEWVALSLLSSLSFSLALTLTLTLSLWGFTSHCSASKSVRTFVVVMVTDIKRWLNWSWNKDQIEKKSALIIGMTYQIKIVCLRNKVICLGVGDRRYLSRCNLNSLG